MSVDERLRGAYARDATSDPADLAAPYGAVMAGSRRRRRQRLLAGTSVLAAAVAVVAAIALSTGGPDETLRPAPPGPSMSVTPPDAGLAPEGFQGAWRSQPLTRELVADGLREAGLGAYAQEFVQTVLPAGRFRVTLHVTGDVVTSRLGQLEAHRARVLRAERNVVELRPDGAGTGGTNLLLALYQHTMTLHFQATDVAPPPNWQEFPVAVYDVATYENTFTRVD